jgi:hypothetical protein
METVTGTPDLNKALAAFQAEAPQITKDQKGIIPGKEGKRGYEYSYADLAGVCAAAFPLLSKHGLSFFAKPAIIGNQFGLVCKLKHASGDEEEGFYPLPQAGTQQQIGSAITYGRRYSMLMMTGLAPADDDDGAAASTERQDFAPRSAAEAFENAAPAPPRQQANGNGHAPQADPDVIAEWGVKIDGILTNEDADRADAELREVFRGGQMDPMTAGAIRKAIKAKKDSLGTAPAITADGAADEETGALARRAIEAVTIEDLTAVRNDAREARKLTSAFMHEGKPVTLGQFTARRKAEMEQQPETAGAR